jgi:uncharacterized membrane protein
MGYLETTMEVDAPVHLCFEMWTCSQCPSPFFRVVESSLTRGNQTFWQWQITDPHLQKPIQWETVLDVLDEDRVISWHSAERALVDASGAIQFEALGEERTRLHVEIMLNPPVKSGEFVGELFGKRVEQMLFEDLQAFKAHAERLVSMEKPQETPVNTQHMGRAGHPHQDQAHRHDTQRAPEYDSEI